ncbi:flavin reductase family protein [Nocardia sp. NBC_00416]|uniref:flavin reductase family protein n=1 Tax=Nocardia sp. NBC_00416 TaxID=2975991 RepID=UPI002E2328F2
MSDQHFRDLMAGVCAPVTVVTTADAQGPHGATVSSLASLSLRPALISIALDHRSALLARIRDRGRFAVNVLASGQDQLATLFATRGADRFATTGWSLAEGLPRLDGVVGWAACDVWQTVEAGDHLLLIGSVTRAASTQEAPLVYGHRTFGTHSRFAARPRRPIVDDITACSR